MKIAKILSAAAAVATVAAIGATASATVTQPASTADGCQISSGMYLVQVYNAGNEAEGKPATNYGLKLSDIASISVTVTPAEPDWWDGTFGGSIVTSCGPASATPADHNWPSNEFWGVIDEDLEIATRADDKAVLFEKTGDLTYTGTVTLGDNNCIYDVDAIEGGYAQIGMQEWGNGMTDITVLNVSCYDASGNLMISFDELGNATVAGGSTVVDTDAPADTGATDENKGSPDTGVEGVAVVAGLAVVAAGAVALSKKRK